MKIFKNLRFYLMLGLFILIGIVLLLNRYILYGLIVLGATSLMYLLWAAFIRDKDEKISGLVKELEKTKNLITGLQEENNELRSRRLNISELRNILDLGLMQVNTSFTRTWNDKFEEDGKSLHFIGALQVRIIARYGIDLKELRIKQNREKNEVIVANINPRFLSFNDFDYEWKIAEVMEYTKPWFGSGQWKKSPTLEVIVSRLKEDLRARTHQEVKTGPEELDWVMDPLRKQIEGTIEMVLGSPYRSVKFVETPDDTFVNLDEFPGFGSISMEKALPLPGRDPGD